MACTSIVVGKKASVDGSVINSHTADCHRSGSQIVYVPAAEHPPLAQRTLTRRREDNTQSRAWLPDAVGGVVWFGYANPAMTTYAPLYAGITDLPDDFKSEGRMTGFSRRSAFWAFRRVATVAAHRWGDMRRDVAAVRDPMQEKFLAAQKAIQEEACKFFETDPSRARAYLTEESKKACIEATDAYWNLGDLLWSKYDERW